MTEKVKQVIITEVRLKELLIAELELDAIKESERQGHFTLKQCDVFESEKLRIMNTKYFDKELSK